MGKIIQFPRPEETASDEEKTVLAIAHEIDAVLMKHLQAGTIDPHDLAGLLAHRLGSLMRHLDQKGALCHACVEVLKTQAAVE